ncbi:MAG: ROK family protein [Gammaproteobacteria bacterium]|nr:ROK family protein [Gammaproteobacteria bacterium]MDH5593451.1 ROK family protein [Gammaproteobacteria bacterium]
MIRLGIDLGGTKIEIIALDEQGKEILRERTSTPQLDYPATLETIKNLIIESEKSLGTQGSIGIGMPGALSVATGLVKNSNSVALNGKPLKEDLEKSLGREIRVTNDANCFALSEATDGAGKNAPVVFGIIVGTGTGGGIVINRKVLVGPNAIAGEWGHNPLPWPQQDELPGRDCYCGKKGCIETFLSGPGMAADHLQVSGNKLTAPEIVQLAEQGDTACEQTLQRYEDRMARATASVINIIDPDAIILGGGMSNIKRLYHNVPELWKKYVFSDRVDTRLLPPVYGDSSGVRGAAWLWD